MKYLFAALLIANSSLAQKTPSVKDFKWLEGTWKLEDKEIFEKWQMVSDTMMTGIGFHHEIHEHEKGEFEKEVILDEALRLVSRGNKIFYIPFITANQSNATPVEFEIISFTKKSFVASNPNHGFPQRIVYKLIDEKHLNAYIEGKENGKSKRTDFQFTKAD